MASRAIAGRARRGVSVALCTAFLSGVGVLFAGSAALAQAVAENARLSGDEARTRFVVDISKDVRSGEIGIRALADPYRVVIDLPDVELNLPQGLGQEGRGLVSAYRYGKFKSLGVRIVLDATAPVLIERHYVQPAKHGQPARLVVVLARTDRATFLANLKKMRRERAEDTPAAKHPLSGLAKKRESDKPLIVLDPGHGGIDPGAKSPGGLEEKEVVLGFAKALRDKLLATKRYDVALTREDDTFIALGDRVEFARQLGGELFISIHADSLPNRHAKKVSGATVYTLSEKASDAEARALAAKENRSDIIAGVDLPAESDDVTSILIDLAQRETKNLSITFAGTVLTSLKDGALISKKPHRHAGFRVLKAPDVPSVLIELGYLTHPEDEKKLQSSTWRNKIAGGLVKAVDAYFAKHVARVPF